MEEIKPKPPVARLHCRHYSYQGDIMTGGPVCAKGIELQGSNRSMLGFMPCMPEPRGHCDLREEWSTEERVEWSAWAASAALRAVVALKAIPHSGPGTHGEIACPACGTGRIGYGYASVNGHLAAQCSTPNCFSVIQ